MELGPQRPSPLWSLGPNSIIALYMDPLGLAFTRACKLSVEVHVEKPSSMQGCGNRNLDCDVFRVGLHCKVTVWRVGFRRIYVELNPKP